MPEACPPPSSAPTEGVFYRLTEPQLSPGNIPLKGSWRKPYKSRGEYYGRTDVCEAHAFSVFGSLEAIQEARKINPWAAKKSLAKVEILPTMGNVLETASDLADSHHDWWSSPYNLVPESVVIEESKEMS